MRLSRPWLVLPVLVVAVATGCSSSGSIKPGPGPAGPNPALVKAADLPPCPPSSATPVSGGLPNVTLDCLGDGPAVHLAGLTGKPTVVNIWAAWCGPCQNEQPYLSSVYSAMKSKVRFLGVDTVDSADDALSFSAHDAVRYPSVVDPDKKALLGVHVAPGPPETVFVDRAGKVVHVHPGEYKTAAALRHDVATYLHVT